MNKKNIEKGKYIKDKRISKKGEKGEKELF